MWIDKDLKEYKQVLSLIFNCLFYLNKYASF